MPFRLFSIFIGATLKGKDMLPMGSIFFPLIVAPFQMLFCLFDLILYIPVKIFSQVGAGLPGLNHY